MTIISVLYGELASELAYELASDIFCHTQPESTKLERIMLSAQQSRDK